MNIVLQIVAVILGTFLIGLSIISPVMFIIMLFVREERGRIKSKKRLTSKTRHGNMRQPWRG
jgi:RsiW-degrading membrane proteinase PrsW (M82 family)